MKMIKIGNDCKNRDDSWEARLDFEGYYIDGGYGSDEIEALLALNNDLERHVDTIKKAQQEILNRVEEKAREVDNFLSIYHSNAKFSVFYDITDHPSKTFVVTSAIGCKEMKHYGKTISEVIKKAEAYYADSRVEKAITGDNENENNTTN